MKLLNKYLSYLIAIYFLLTFLIGMSYVLQGSIRFDADISRDFLLLDELQTKKYMLIGPRASGIPGVFHGPLWIYLNFPAYLLGGGNPVIVGLGWSALIGFFLLSSYYLLKNIINKKTALIFTLLISGVLIPWHHQLLNPFGAFMLMPSLVFLLTKFKKQSSNQIFALILLTLGAMIQFQMAVGGPISILVFFWLAKQIHHKKNYSKILLLPIFFIPLLTFIIFELRHDFSQLRSVITFVAGKSGAQYTSIFRRLIQRITLISQDSISLFYKPLHYLNIIGLTAIAFQKYKNIFKLKKNQSGIFNISFYLFLGYFFISLFFNGILLVYYWFPLTPLAILMISQILSNIQRKYLLLVLPILLISQIGYGIYYMNTANKAIGLNEDDWLFQKNMVEKLFEGEESEFGYFIYTPDVFAYESKAAMTYAIKRHPEKNVIRYKKQPVTYLIVSPADRIRPEVNPDAWKDSRLHLMATPSATYYFPDGYTVEKHYLSRELINVAPDSTIDDWLHFR